MPLWLLIGISAAFYIWNNVLFPPPDPPKPVPQSFTVADTDEGVSVPAIYGTVRIDQPIMVWHGNEGFVDGTPFGVQFIYQIDMLFVLGVPAYNLNLGSLRLGRIWWGQTLVENSSVWNLYGTQQADFRVDQGQNNIAVVGTIQFFDGFPTQNVGAAVLPAAMLTRDGADPTIIPGYRNQVCVALSLSSPPGTVITDAGGIIVLGGYHMSSSPQVPQISFEVLYGGPDGIRE